MIRLLALLLALTVIVHLAWTRADADRAGASIAHAICASRPQPEVCR